MQFDNRVAKHKLLTFIKGLRLANNFELYEAYKNEEIGQLILVEASIYDNGILPSKRYGNAIALATELDFPETTKYLCEHKEETGLDDTDVVLNDGLFTSLIKEFLFVQVVKGVMTTDRKDMDNQSKIILRSMINMIAGHDYKKAKKVKKMIYQQPCNMKAYLNSAQLYESMQNYSLCNDTEDILRYKLLNQKSNYCFLPSVRKGNALALALELNNYKVAEYIYDHSKEFGIDVDHTIKSKKEECRWSAREELIYSLYTYDYEKEMNSIDFVSEKLGEKTANKYAKIEDDNKAALDRLINKLDISKEELKYMGYEKGKQKVKAL